MMRMYKIQGVKIISWMLCWVMVLCNGLNESVNWPLRIVDLRRSPFNMKLTIQACIGLLNRKETNESPAYSIFENNDLKWLETVAGVSQPSKYSVSRDEFLRYCTRAPFVKGFIVYDQLEHQRFLPSILTLSGVKQLLPVESRQINLTRVEATGKFLFRVENQWKGYSLVDVTAFMHETYVNQTKYLAKLNPGYKSNSLAGNIFEKLDKKKHMPLKLVDFVIKERMFCMFLPLSCIPFTSERKLFERIVKNNPWERPIKVFGYDNSWALAGNIFEAETFCDAEHNLGQIATDGTSNLAFFSRKEKITQPLLTNPKQPSQKYNSKNTYISLVLGDGDNINDVKTYMFQEMKQRVHMCAESPDTCFPLLWTMSSHLLYLAPDIVSWFYRKARMTGKDYFILPPSGFLYAYPASMDKITEEKFVHDTEEACVLLGTNATMDWEWFFGWRRDVKSYLPMYSKKGIVRALFTVNVPYLFPILGFKGRLAIALNKTVLFKPLADWQRTRGGKPVLPFDKKDNLTPAQFANKINNLKKGTISYVYLTHDAGGRLIDLYHLVGNLSDHVRVVDANTLADVAIEANQNKVPPLSFETNDILQYVEDV